MKRQTNRLAGLGSLLIIGAITACGGSSVPSAAPDNQEPTMLDIAGAVQKGPFVLGSTITVSVLNKEGNPTGEVFNTQTINDKGEFSINAPTSGLLLLEGTGYYFNEVSGELSAGTLTLRAIVKPTSGAGQSAYLNVLTHLSSNRIRKLLKDGLNFKTAREQAESEVRAALNISPTKSISFDSSSSLNLLGGDTDANAYLLATSAVLIEAARSKSGPVESNLQELLNGLAGKIEATGTISVADHDLLTSAIRKMDPNVVMANMVTRIKALDVHFTVPDINRILDTDEDGILNDRDRCPKSALHNQGNTWSEESCCFATDHDGGDGACVKRGTCSEGYHAGEGKTCCNEGYHDGGGGLKQCVPEGTCSPGVMYNIKDASCGIEYALSLGHGISNIITRRDCLTHRHLPAWLLDREGGSWEMFLTFQPKCPLENSDPARVVSHSIQFPFIGRYEISIDASKLSANCSPDVKQHWMLCAVGRDSTGGPALWTASLDLFYSSINGQDCVESSQCDLGSVCEKRSGKCVLGCYATSDCAAFEICQGGVGADAIGSCINDRNSARPYCQSCVTGDSCGAQGNLCLKDSYCGVDCSQGQECAAGFECRDALLFWNARSCTDSSECVRADFPCTDDADCPLHAQCYKMTGASRGSCRSQCPFSENGRSYCSCMADSDCPAQTCNTARGLCSLDARACSSDMDCVHLRCVDVGTHGACRTGSQCKPANNLSCFDLPGR